MYLRIVAKVFTNRATLYASSIPPHNVCIQCIQWMYLCVQLEDETAFTLHKRLPYMCLADCLVNTAVRDGLNNLALEYVCVHEATRKEDPGVMLLSEFTSCMRVMRGAIRINPWKVCTAWR